MAKSKFENITCESGCKQLNLSFKIERLKQRFKKKCTPQEQYLKINDSEWLKFKTTKQSRIRAS